MPAVGESSPPSTRLCHVNLMVDTLLRNVSLEDLLPIVRVTLATSPPTVTATFTEAARRRLLKSSATNAADPSTLCVETADKASDAFKPVLRQARALYGAGEGLASLKILLAVATRFRSTNWKESANEWENLLADVSADFAQAIVSAKVEEESKGVDRDDELESTKIALRREFDEWEEVAKALGVESPFESAAASLKAWKTAP